MMEDQNTLTFTCFVCLLVVFIVMAVMFILALFKRLWDIFRAFERQQEKKRHAEIGSHILRTIELESHE